MLAGRLGSIAVRRARWGAMTEAEKAAGAAELRETAVGRADLLAEVAGLALGTSESKGQEYVARGQAVAELCRLAGADETLIPQWAEEGRGRAASRRKPPFSDPGSRRTGRLHGSPSARPRRACQRPDRQKRSPAWSSAAGRSSLSWLQSSSSFSANATSKAQDHVSSADPGNWRS
jgi:hypothetical protein